MSCCLCLIADCFVNDTPTTETYSYCHTLSLHDALPISERELSERMGMSRVTIRKGIQKLIEEGLLFRRHGSGTYVSDRIEARGAMLTSFSEDARSRGD